MDRRTRRLAAIMFTDIVNFTGLTQQNEAMALELLENHQRQLRPLFDQHQGREVKMLGDGFLVVFDSALQAAKCAIEIQHLLYESQLGTPQDQQVRVRIGIHLGDIEEHESDVFGDDVNIASRIESISAPGGICLSDDAARRVRGKIRLPLQSLGPVSLKNIQHPVEIYQIKLPWGSAPPLSRRFMRLLRQPAVLGVASALLVLSLAGWWAWTQQGALPLPNGPTTTSSPAVETAASGAGIDTDQASDIRSLAILPFANLSPDEENEYFSDGLTEELINAFSRIEGLRVISRTSVFAYKNRAMDLREIGEKLGVDAILEGSVRKAGDTVRITAKLIDVQSDGPLWSETYEREVIDVFAIQDELTRAIVDTLRLQFLEGEAIELVTQATDSAEAYNLYLLGRFYWNKRTEEGFVKAIEHFNRALTLDPNYAEAYAGLADSYSLLADYGFMDNETAYPEARKAALTALTLDDTLADAHASLGLIKMNYDQDAASAETQFQKALKLNPSYASAHQWYSILLEKMGRQEEAQAQAELALQLDPLSPVINYNVGNRYQDAGEYHKALQQFEQALEVEPNYDTALWGKYAVQQRLWDQEGMEQTLLRLIEAAPTDPNPYSQYAQYLMWNGRRDEAMAAMQHALALNDNEVSVLEDYAQLLYWNHEYEKAVQYAKQALELNPESSRALLLISSASLQLGHKHDAASAYLQQMMHTGGFSEKDLEKLVTELDLENLDFDFTFDLDFDNLGEFFSNFDFGKFVKLSIETRLNKTKADCGDDAYHVAVLYAISEEAEKSIVCLGKAFDENAPGLLNLIVDPVFDAIRDDPRVLELLREIGIDIHHNAMGAHAESAEEDAETDPDDGQENEP